MILPMANFHKLDEGANVHDLYDALEAEPALWDQDTLRQTYPGTSHADTQCIILRGPSVMGSVEAIQDNLVAVDYPALLDLPEAGFLMYNIAARIGTQVLGRVMLTKLKPGGVITPHIDEGLYAHHYSRFHLPIRSEHGNWFNCGNARVWMKPGELWWFNHQEEHSVENTSNQPRIHLIVDAITQRQHGQDH